MRNRMIASILYRLKREFGVAIKLQWRETTTVDRAAGTKATHYGAIKIRQAIVLPETFIRDTKVDPNVSSKFHGTFDIGDRGVILDIKDLQGVIPKIDYFIVYLGRRFEIKSVQEYTELSAFFLIVKEAVGSLKNEVFEFALEDELVLTGSMHEFKDHIIIPPQP